MALYFRLASSLCLAYQQGRSLNNGKGVVPCYKLTIENIRLFSIEIMVYRYLASYKNYLNARTAYVLRMQERGRSNGS